MPKPPHDFDPQPTLPATADQLGAVWSQTVTMREAGGAVAAGSWATLPNQPGVAILLDLTVLEGLRREGRGTALLEELVRQMHAHAGVATTPLRRLLALVNQPAVVTRAWLQRSGFVHVHTLNDVHAEHETMVLVRTFD